VPSSLRRVEAAAVVVSDLLKVLAAATAVPAKSVPVAIAPISTRMRRAR